MKRNRWRIILICTAVLLFLLVVLGYINSDAVFYKRLVKQHQLSTPESVFKYLSENTITADQDTVSRQPVSGMPTRDLLQSGHGLWCDEGAIALSTILKYTSGDYPCRLVDMIGMDNIAHHTVLQVYENDRWKTYDMIARTDSISPENTVTFKVLRLRYRSWNKRQRIYHFLLENNSILKYFFFRGRGVY